MRYIPSRKAAVNVGLQHSVVLPGDVLNKFILNLAAVPYPGSGLSGRSLASGIEPVAVHVPSFTALVHLSPTSLGLNETIPLTRE